MRNVPKGVRAALCVAMLALIGGCARQPILPTPPIIEGWDYSELPVTYDPRTLFQYMDGKARVYLDYGFVRLDHVQFGRPGEVITQQYTNESLKDVLRRHGKPMTGRKEELLEKVAEVLCERYEEMLPALDEHFGKQKYLKIPRTDTPSLFPLVQEADLVDRTVLAMYVIKHLRGNTILDASHENDTYEVRDLVRALLCGEISLSGCFIAVQEPPSSG